ncbi:MAG: LysM peptidoglycan-binding domain-containing protein [Acidobacteriota bacterium]
MEEKKPDFSNVTSGSSSSADDKKGDFANVVSGSSSTAPKADSDIDGGTTLRMYVVEPGDSLSKIARKFYGDAHAWKRIYEENKDVIKNPDLIQPGWKLRIPE